MPPRWCCCHGFPELAYTWRHQVRALAEAGFHVLAPDQRGYGGSEQPAAVEAYTVTELVERRGGPARRDRRGRRRGGRPRLRRRRRVGGAAAAPGPVLGRRRPQPAAGAPSARADHAGVPRACSATGSSTSSTSRSPAPPTPTWPPTRRRTLRRLFATPPAGTTRPRAMLAPTRAGFLDRIPEPGALPGVAQRRTTSTSTPTSSPAHGFTGPLNWYRCFDRNWELTADTAGGDDRRARAVHRRQRRRHVGVHAAPPLPRSGERTLSGSAGRGRRTLADRGVSGRCQSAVDRVPSRLRCDLPHGWVCLLRVGAHSSGGKLT